MIAGANTLQNFRGFAQATPRNFTPRNPAANLRHQAITFVSGGTNTPDEFLPKPSHEAEAPAEDSEDESEDEDQEEFDDSGIQTNIVMETDIDIDISRTAMANMDIRGSAEITEPDVDDDSPNTDVVGVDKGASKATSASQDAPLFFVDTLGDPALVRTSKASGKRPAKRDPSPAPSNSSDEVVVFHGRNNPVKGDDPVAPAKASDTTRNGSSDDLIESLLINLSNSQPQVQQTPATNDWQSGSQAQPTSATNGWQTGPQVQPPYQKAIGWASRTPNFETEVNSDATWAPAPSGSWWKKKNKGKGKPRPDLDPSPAEKMALDEAPKSSKVMFAESDPGGEDAEKTIASLQADWKSVLREKKQVKQSSRELEPEQERIDLKSPQSKRRGKRGRKKDNRQLRNPINSDEEDAAGEAAYDDYMANLAAQMDGNDDGIENTTATAHSTAFGGPSLVVNGEEIADDEVLGSHFEMMGGADSSSTSSGPIGQDRSDVSTDLDSSELEDDLEYTEREQWEDEGDLRQRRHDAMTDEQIARLLAKQQEFGYDGDELILDDGEHVSMPEVMDGVGDIDEARAGLAEMSNYSSNKHGMRRRTTRTSGGPTFVDASLLADTVDQYGANGFDIMDWDRPSLRQTKKGRKGRLPPELDALSDEELKENMRDVWENDRRKKSLKKAEREDLRAQGMLGAAGRSGKADLSKKYPLGMTTTQIFDELRIFMQEDGQQSRPFPPMDKEERKALHDIANALNLKSRSVGVGGDRFPVLYKTSQTFYTAKTFDRAVTASKQGMLSRDGRFAKKFARKNARAGAKGKAGGGSGGATSAATLRNGEVVGAGAAELGKENLGHKLMEKMGWSKGMALGKEGEGRLVPVEQIVRLGTAGLG